MDTKTNTEPHAPNDFDTPSEVSDVLLAFPGHVAHLMPAWDEIPSEYQKPRRDTTAKLWHEFQQRWFFRGLAGVSLTTKPGIDERRALRHLGVIQRSFEPSHEHKMAAVAWLASRWFADVDFGGA